MSRGRPTVLVVDDLPEVISTISSILSADYQVKVAKSGARALELALTRPQPDLILLDILMPEMSGYQVCEKLKSDPSTRDIPVIFLTSSADQQDEVLGFQVGAVDYITKPIAPPVLKARVRTHLSLVEALQHLQDQNHLLESIVQERTREVLERTAQLQDFQEAALIALCSLAETRDNETGNHIRRTQHFVRLLAEKLQELSLRQDVVTPDFIELLFKTAPLHDIGKVGIPDSILLKPARLTEAEFEIMKTHTVLGRDTLKAAQERLQRPSEFLTLAQEIAWTHHEKWNGSGYPQGLSGEDIPLSGRLMAVADVYDALTSKRVYKEALLHSEAVQVIREGRGSHFDPLLTDTFLVVADRFAELSACFADAD